MNHLTNIMFKTPNFEALKQAGFTLTDMHFHSLYSDTFTRINHILNKASELGINVALTDHNSIEGVRRAYNNRHKVNIIPGIEISCVEGHHILVYFPTLDALEDFYIKHVEGRQNKDPYSSTSIKTEELLDACES
ncbi:PHP domain-containing protein, partial [Candidatus Woesearchaeota archaeon]|nr:PHP domain-containing protein [Candidatus Woesearchaeota archaeon]